MLYADASLSTFVVVAVSTLTNLPSSSLPLCQSAAEKVAFVYTALAARAAISGRINLWNDGLLNSTILSVARNLCNASAADLYAASAAALVNQAERMYAALVAELKVVDGGSCACTSSSQLLSTLPLRALSAAARVAYVSQTSCIQVLAAARSGNNTAAQDFVEGT